MPRPTITGTVIRVIDMRHTGPGKNKDYRITITQEAAGMFRVYTEHGPAGRLNNGSERTIRGVSMSAATRMADELCSQKRRQTDAYQVLSDRYLDAPTPPVARSPDSASPPPAATRPKANLDSLTTSRRVILNNLF